jgi:protein-S-isoprenylcysteine O-methyltransferase Ste14
MNAPLKTRIWSVILTVIEALLLLGLLSFAVHGDAQGAYVALALVFAAVGIYFLQAGIRSIGKSFTPWAIPRRSGELVTGGIYKTVRHPIYVGLGLLGMAAVLRSGDITSVYTWIALVIDLIAKASLEEQMLRSQHETYEQYRNSTPAILPERQKSR